MLPDDSVDENPQTAAVNQILSPGSINQGQGLLPYII